MKSLEHLIRAGYQSCIDAQTILSAAHNTAAYRKLIRETPMADEPNIEITKIPEAMAAFECGDLPGEKYGDGEVWVTETSFNHWKVQHDHDVSKKAAPL